MIDKSSFKERIIFTDHVQNAEYYSVINACVHTSIAPKPFGLVITEAMAYGVPIVASNLDNQRR